MGQIKDVVLDGPLHIRFKGIYDNEKVYNAIRGFIDEHGYDFLEPKYKEKAAGPTGNEGEIIIYCEKKITEYVMYSMDILIKFWNDRNFDAEVDGKTKKLSEGRIMIKIVASIEFDYSGDVKGKFVEWLEVFLIRKLFQDYYITKYYVPLWIEAYDLQATVKTELGFSN